MATPVKGVDRESPRRKVSGEDDPVQNADPEYAGGANQISLNKARENFAKFGAKEERHRGNVRPPKPEELE